MTKDVTETGAKTAAVPACHSGPHRQQGDHVGSDTVDIRAKRKRKHGHGPEARVQQDLGPSVSEAGG
jgi:hypothetical protein